MPEHHCGGSRDGPESRHWRVTVNVGAAGIIGDALLYWAVKNGHKEVVKLLLARGDIDVNLYGAHCSTPLLLAVEGRHEEVMKLLNSGTGVHRAELLYAANQRHEEMVKILLTRDDINVNAEDENVCSFLGSLAWVRDFGEAAAHTG